MPAVTIRYAFPDDARAVARLAELDSREVPSAPLLLVEIDGEIWVALSLSDGVAVADPFRRTAALIELLEARASQLHGPAQARSRWRRSRATSSGAVVRTDPRS
jgi:hypothetical protein